MKFLVDQFWPRLCRFCAAAAQEAPVCHACWAELPWNAAACPRCALPDNGGHLCADCAAHPPPVARSTAVFALSTPVDRLIHELKYRRRLADATWLAHSLAKHRLACAAPLPELLLPVPLHRGRLWSRSYNQAGVLAQGLGRTLQRPVALNSVQRLRATSDQIGQSAAARRRAVRGAFAVTADLRDQHVGLVDDVMTTGATLYELARTVLAAGASEVELLVIARTPRGRPRHPSVRH